jgi:hypothetical protein
VACPHFAFQVWEITGKFILKCLGRIINYWFLLIKQHGLSKIIFTTATSPWQFYTAPKSMGFFMTLLCIKIVSWSTVLANTKSFSGMVWYIRVCTISNLLATDSKFVCCQRSGH